jgi:hypothetical protein
MATRATRRDGPSPAWAFSEGRVGCLSSATAATVEKRCRVTLKWAAEFDWQSPELDCAGSSARRTRRISANDATRSRRGSSATVGRQLYILDSVSGVPDCQW